MQYAPYTDEYLSHSTHGTHTDTAT